MAERPRKSRLKRSRQKRRLLDWLTPLVAWVVLVAVPGAGLGFCAAIRAASPPAVPVADAAIVPEKGAVLPLTIIAAEPPDAARRVAAPSTAEAKPASKPPKVTKKAAKPAAKPSKKKAAIDKKTLSKVIVGRASWYGPGFYGKRTASGERFDAKAMTLAHRHLPMGTRVRVTNLANGKVVVARVNDRGPFGSNRVADLSEGAAKRLGISGVARVRLEILTQGG